MSLSLARLCLALAVAASIAVVLQGCGGSGGGGGSGNHTNTTVTTTPNPHPEGPRTPPLSAAAVAKILNQAYMTGLDGKPGDTGVTLSMAAQAADFNANLFCKAAGTNTGCFNGQSDCRMSASLFNWHMINNNWIVDQTFGRATGYVFNQTMVENSLGKCAFVFDGASANNYNNGCGGGALGGNDCNKKTCAYYNICPSTGKTCTAADPEVKNAECTPYGPSAVPTSGSSYQCMYSGPAFDYPRKNYANHLKEMIKQRFKYFNRTHSSIDHNEIVLDERLLIPAIWKDPAPVIPAFIYAKSDKANARADAEAMSKKYSRDYNLKGRVAVLALNDVSDFRPNGPFEVPPELEDTTTTTKSEAKTTTTKKSEAKIIAVI